MCNVRSWICYDFCSTKDKKAAQNHPLTLSFPVAHQHPSLFFNSSYALSHSKSWFYCFPDAQPPPIYKATLPSWLCKYL